MSMQIIIMVTTFTTVGLLIYGLCVLIGKRREIRERFSKRKLQATPLTRREQKKSTLKDIVLGAITSFGQLTLGKEQTRTDVSDLRLTLIQAGFRYINAVALFYGVKAISAMVLPICYLLVMMWKAQVTSFNLGISAAIAGLGYYLPNYALKRALRKRQERIDRALPDVLDLMIVSLEAGLSLQSTLNHVADEVRRISKEMHRELQITNAELRTGIPRDQALKNLGERTGVQSVKSLIALMIQSEKMGASIAQSLRTHADFVRVQRGQRAETLAAKMPIKIIFPTLFCIFPSIFIVILGPAAIQIYRGLLKK